MALFTQSIFWYFCICGYLLYHFNNVWDAADFCLSASEVKDVISAWMFKNEHYLDFFPPLYQAMGLVLFFIQIMGGIKCHQACKLMSIK